MDYPQIKFGNLIAYRNLHYHQNYSFGDILRKFGGNRTFRIDFVYLLSSTPKIGILHAVLKKPRRGQNSEFCHIESHGKNNVTSIIKTAIDFIFSTHRVYLYSIHISLIVFKFYSRSYKMVP